jgi:hypothetical protein
MEFGNILVEEQKSVSEGRLVEEYNRVRYEQPLTPPTQKKSEYSW